MLKPTTSGWPGVEIRVDLFNSEIRVKKKSVKSALKFVLLRLLGFKTKT